MVEYINNQTTLPRKGSIMFEFMRGTNETMKKSLNKFKLMNKYFLVPLYRANILPLFLIGRKVVLLYTKGRKSGKTRITPVEYRRYNEKVLLFSSRGKKGDWYRNIKGNPESFKIKIGLKTYKPKISETTLDEKIEILEWYVEKFPGTAKELFGYNKEDKVTKELLYPIADFLEILQLEI